MEHRILRLGLEIDGKLNVYENADIKVKIVKSADPKQNSCEISISNLSQVNRDSLITETSPWNPNPKPKLLTVEAGRKSTGVGQVFMGNITSAIPTLPPDIKLTMKAQTQESSKYQYSSVSMGRSSTLSEISKEVANQFGLTLMFQARDRKIGNFTYNGSLFGQVQKIQDIGGVDTYIDDRLLVVKDFGKGLEGTARVVSVNTGMIDIPLITEKGIDVKVMFDPSFRLGESIEIQSELNKAANGQYVIYAMTIELATRSQEWYIKLSCNNDNIKSLIAKREAETKAKI